MLRRRPDRTFYLSPSMAMQAPPESVAYVAMLSPGGGRDALVTLDARAGSATAGQVLGRVEMPDAGDELHHFGWNACSSCLCPDAPHPHVERRYLVMPGLQSSRVHILDTKADPVSPRLVRTLEREAIASATGYSRPLTTHCGPDGVYVNALGAPGGDGPGGIFTLDPETFEIRGRWEANRGPQFLTYDFRWHLGHDALITSEWGTPQMVEAGVIPERLLAGGYGHALHVWNLRTRTYEQTIDLGAEHQMVLELRPAHDPRKAYGFAGVVTSVTDLSASVWLWYREGHGRQGKWAVRKVIQIPAEPADADRLPPILRRFGAVPPLLTAVNLSLDDRFLYVSCWGTGELRQYDVSDPLLPRLVSSLRIGGILRRAPHPSLAGVPLNGGPQRVEISRDGRRVYVTNSLYERWDEQFYPDGVRGWLARVHAHERGMVFDESCFVQFDGLRPHQVRLDGGDASSDSYCYS